MLDHYILAFLGSILDLSALILFFFVFMKKRKKYIPFSFLIISFVLDELIIFIITEILLSNISFGAGIIRVVISLATTFLLTFFYESTLINRFFFAISFQSISVVSEFIAQVIVQFYLRLPENSLTQIEDLICFLTAPISLFFIILLFIIFNKRKYSLSVQHYILLLNAPIITIIAAFNRNVLESTSENQLSYAFLITGFIIINYGNFVLLILSANSFNEKEKINHILRQNEYQQEKYNQLSSAYKKLRKYHHDTNKRFMYINECIRNEKYDAIIPYLESSMDELNSSYSKINTGNLVIDSFVSNYLLFAEDNNIDFQPDLQIDATIIPINDYDLSIVIGNLLDNAINACNEISDNNKKYIRLYIRTDLESDQFVIHIINSKTQKTAPANDNRIIHGYGLINIQEHIEKLFGIMNSKETENEFETTVIIPLTPPKQSERNTK